MVYYIRWVELLNSWLVLVVCECKELLWWGDFLCVGLKRKCVGRDSLCMEVCGGLVYGRVGVVLIWGDIYMFGLGVGDVEGSSL